MNTFFGIMIPFAGTTAGAACVFFMMGQMRTNVEKSLLGFASGVMMAASVWSLLLPSISMAEGMGNFAFIPAAIGFLAGIGGMLLLDQIVPEIYLKDGGKAKKGSSWSKTAMLILAVTIHNIPEGMAVGVVFAGVLSGQAGIAMADAFALAVGIAIQNFPEGAIVSMPLKGEGTGKGRAFLGGMASGVVEPISAFLTILLSAYSGFCCRGHGLRGGGGADTGGVQGSPFPYRNHRLCRRVFGHDGFGCGAGIRGEHYASSI